MKDLLANQRNKTGRLRFISLLFALLLLPLGAWADGYFMINITPGGGKWVSDTENNEYYYYYTDLFGDGTASYDVASNTLTLNGINLALSGEYQDASFISCNDEDHPSLKVRLVGNNVLTLGDNYANFFYGEALEFITDDNNPGSLTINTPSEYTNDLFENSSNSGDPTITPTYSNGLCLAHSGNTYTVQVPVSYNITVAGTAVTSANASNVLNDDYSSVSYNASTNTLTLKGVHLNSTNNGISVSSDLNINLVGYSNVGTINVTSGTLNFTTSTTLPGCLKTNITGNSTITYGAGTGLSWDGTMVKSSGTNPYIIYATGYKGDDDEYGIDNGDIIAYNNNGSQVELGNPDVTVVNSQNNASIDYFRVPSVAGDPVSSFLYPIDLEDNTLYTKAYLLFDWGTCTNRDVKVRVREYNSNSSPNSGEFRSNEVSLPSDGGLVEIPLTGTVTSDLILLYFTSTTGEFSFIPISVGFQKTESYGLTVGGVEVTSNNASSITGTNISGTVSFDATENTLTLNGATITGSIVKTTSEAVDQLIINLVGTNTVNGQISFQSEDRMYLGDLSFTGSGSLIIASNDEYGVFDEVSSVNTGEGLYIATDSPDPQCYNGYYINGTTADDNSVKSLTVSTSVTYPIWVYNTSTTHYTQLTAAAPTFTTPSANVDENHSGSVSFSDNTLTLTNFLCKTTEGYDYVFFVGKSLQNLTVNLVGESSIFQNGFHYAKLQETEEEPTLTFTTSNNGKLTYESDPEFWGNVTLNYENGLGYYSYVVSTDWPRLIIGGTYVRGTTNTVEGYSNVSFDDNTKTLTLGGVTIGSQDDTVADIEAYVKDLKVEISGDNTVYGRFLAFYEENGNKAGTITFKKKSGAETANLTVSGEGDGGPIYNFVSSTLEEGLYISGVDTDNDPVFSLSYYDGAYHDSNIPDNTLKELLITSNEPDTKLWIGELPVTSTNAGNVFEGDDDLDGKVSYDMETQTLSLKGVTMGDDIVSNVGTLTIDLTGSNSILSISASGNATALAFTGDGALTLGNSDGVITNFSSVDTGDFNLLSNSTPGIHWNALNKMYMTFDDSEIATELTLTKATVYPLWVGGVQVTSDNASNITGTNIQGGKVSYDAATSTLTLNGPEQQYGMLSLYTNENNPEPMITCNGDLTIQLIGNNGINFSGSYSNYAIKNTGNSGTLTITQSGTDVALNITTEKNEGASMGLCDGFTAVNFANGLAYIVRNGSRTISTLDLASPEFNVYENEISFSLSTGLLYGTSNGAVVAAEYFYKITYANASTEGSGVEHELASDFPSFNLDASQKIAVTDLAGACTIEAYTKLNGATSTANKAKKFGPAESPMRLVYGADPVDLVLAPAIEDGDGIKINGIEANVTYNSTTGKVSSETMGSQGGIVSLSYASETVQTLLLNNYFDMDFDVVPPAPTINLAAGEYLNTHANVTVTSAELANTTIKYQWDDGDATDYPSEGGIPLQTGTLKAWVVYTAGDTPLASDVSEAAFTVLNPAIAMSVYEGQSNEKRLLLQNESGMSMYYAIDYVSTDLNDVPETLYGQAPELLGPCTVTAYAKSGSVQGTTFTGKLFGFAADAVTTSYASQANAPAIVPDFNGSVTYDYSDWVAYLSVNAQGQITPIKVTEAGNAASVSATFIFSENPSFTVLNAEGPSQAATNYYVDGAFSVTINPLELTVTPDNVTVDAGETIVLTFKYAGFAEGEDKTFLTTEPTASYGNADVTKPGSYTITVSGGEAQNYTFVYETGTLTVKRRLNVSFGENNEWATYCATEDLATPQGLQAYQVTNVSGTTVSTEEVGYIPKNTAVLLKMTNADYVLSASAYTGATSTFDTTNKLEGTTEATSVSEINGNVYVLYNDQFVKATSGTIPALRGYLVVSTTNARALDIVIGDATGFSDVRGQIEDAQEAIYNLQGQRVSKAQKGLVIVNGKKVVKK